MMATAVNRFDLLVVHDTEHLVDQMYAPVVDHTAAMLLLAAPVTGNAARALVARLNRGNLAESARAIRLTGHQIVAVKATVLVCGKELACTLCLFADLLQLLAIKRNRLFGNNVLSRAKSLDRKRLVKLVRNGERNEIYAGIAAAVNKQAAQYGIRVEDVKIKQFDLPDSNLNAVYSRMISERNQMAEKYTADGNYEASIIRNDVDKQVNITVSNAKAEAAKLEAEGEAEYMRLLAAAYNSKDKKDFYEFTLALDALKQSLTGDEKTVILDGNSELAQILMGAN